MWVTGVQTCALPILKRFFGCEKQLCPDTAEEIWNFCNEQLACDEELRVRGIIKRMRVETIITTDDPADDLEWHKKLAADISFETNVLPGWRPTAAMDINNAGYAAYIKKLGKAAGVNIDNFTDLKTALRNRMEYFNAHGCCACDHGIKQLAYMPATEETIDTVFAKRLHGEILSTEDVGQYHYAILSYLAREYARLGWVMELHLGVMRDVNSVMYDKLGSDTGYDCVDTSSGITGISQFANDLNTEGLLPKMLIFSINPSDNPVINTLAWCFSQEGVKGKVQQGSAWWFNDSYSGMEQQIINFAEEGVLANFVGMLTDSRSFLSYTRHEYFRRILCRIIGNWVDNGLYPADLEHLGSIVQDICYNNAKVFFNG
jgi:glucuronate isomerase